MSKKKKNNITNNQVKKVLNNIPQPKVETSIVPKSEVTDNKPKFPDKFPFWARLKISKYRTTLVIDSDLALNKKTKELEDGFVHREATSQYHKGFTKIEPNPDKDKQEPMYLKSPRKLPKFLFLPHNKELTMPEELLKLYDKNNHKDDKK